MHTRTRNGTHLLSIAIVAINGPHLAGQPASSTREASGNFYRVSEDSECVKRLGHKTESPFLSRKTSIFI
jgi:hypothetical protein